MERKKILGEKEILMRVCLLVYFCYIFLNLTIETIHYQK